MLLNFDHYTEAYDWPLRYFSPEEVADSRDGSVRLWVPFGLKMDTLRKELGEPIFVTSWYRTAEHDASIGGAGNHTGGWAADVTADNRYDLLRIAFNLKFIGVGVASSFIHLDDNLQYLTEGFRPALWTYS